MVDLFKIFGPACVRGFLANVLFMMILYCVVGLMIETRESGPSDLTDGWGRAMVACLVSFFVFLWTSAE